MKRTIRPLVVKCRMAPLAACPNILWNSKTALAPPYVMTVWPRIDGAAEYAPPKIPLPYGLLVAADMAVALVSRCTPPLPFQLRVQDANLQFVALYGLPCGFVHCLRNISFQA